jgi:uncharacterized protein with HEPN domain
MGFPLIGLRNQIIHGYDSISEENIYSVIVNHLPLLKTEVEQLLKSNHQYTSGSDANQK